jgi:hypothetical protein
MLAERSVILPLKIVLGNLRHVVTAAVTGPTLLTGICFCGHCSGAMTIRTGKSGRDRLRRPRNSDGQVGYPWSPPQTLRMPPIARKSGGGARSSGFMFRSNRVSRNLKARAECNPVPSRRLILTTEDVERTVTTADRSKSKLICVANHPCRARVMARDKSADGQFWYSATTTAVYRRLSCPSRTTNPENVTLHDTLAALSAAADAKVGKPHDPQQMKAERSR